MKKLLSLSLSLLLIVLVACTENVMLTVTFDYGYDNKTELVEVRSGEKVARPTPDPTRAGYSFDDWYLGETPYQFNLEVTEDITIVAQWTDDSIADAAIDDDLAEIVTKISSASVLGDRLPFDTRGTNRTRFSYTTSKPGVVTSGGYIIRPTIAEGAQVVTITVNGTLSTTRKSKTIEVTIPAVEYNETVTKTVDLDFTNTTPEYSIIDQTLKTYFVGEGSVPYVDVEDFITLLGQGDPESEANSLFYADDVEYLLNDQVLTVSYDISYEQESGDPIIETYQLIADFETNTIKIDSFDFFDGYIRSTSTNYADKISYGETYYEDATGVTFDLNKYNINIFLYEDDLEQQYLMPFHLVNLLFTYGTYYNVYYNGDNYHGVYGQPDAALQKEIKTSSTNTQTVPYDTALFTYHSLAFVFDYLYGLKDIKEVESYYEYLIPRANTLLSGNSFNLTQGIYDFIYKDIDELHSSFLFYGHYYDVNESPAPAYINDGTIRGQYVLNWSRGYVTASNAYTAAFPNGAPDYRLLDEETAVINLESFDTATVDDPLGADSDRFMEETLNALFTAQPGTKNIVIDLSQNGGGNIGALFRVLGYMTEKPIEISYQNPTDGSKLTYFVEVSTVAREDVNWYILTSPITFSAANLMTAVAKNQGIATIIGQNSFGGASSITPIILPDGTMISISSLNVLSLRVTNEDGTYAYNHIEFGIETDYAILNSRLYQNQYILEAIAATSVNN